MTNKDEHGGRPTHIQLPHPKFSESDIESGDRHDEQYGDAVSPLDMPPGQTDRLGSTQADACLSGRGQSRRGSGNSSLLQMLNIQEPPSPAEIAMAAMQYLPYPIMILNGSKTPVMANDAMGRLLGTEDTDDNPKGANYIGISSRFRGHNLSQLGIDMLQEGRPVWVNWESFLDSLVGDLRDGREKNSHQPEPESEEGDVTPTAEPKRQLRDCGNTSTVHNAVVEVLLSPSK
jgi:hypothetical protein